MVGGRAVLTMNDSATITRNTAFANVRPRGGGVRDGGGRLVGVICGPNANANVFDNSPVDCYP
jgi:hypothetical protein